MAGQPGILAGSLVVYAVVALAPSALFWCALRIPGLYRRWRRHRVVVVPAGPPIERLAADLRRVHRQLAGFEPGTPAARRLGTRQAYDELLTQACREVGVEHRLDELGEGMDREIERLRIEHSLRESGLAVP